MDSPLPIPPKSTSEGAGEAAARSSTTFSEVVSLGLGRYRVQLGGSFRPAWVATLCSELAARRISIDEAHARRGSDGVWLAQLQVVALSGAPDVELVPYVELAEMPIARVPSSFAIDAHRLESVPERADALLLSIEAPDSLGLLGSLLASLAALLLFPVEMRIETRGGRAYDRLWLAGIGGSAPSAGAREALLRRLSSWSRQENTPRT